MPSVDETSLKDRYLDKLKENVDGVRKLIAR